MAGGALLSLEKIRTLENEGYGTQSPESKLRWLKAYGRLNEDYASGDSAGPQGTSER